jgi:hypothetical protein
MALAGACGLPAPTSQPAAYGTPEALAVVSDSRITEASGIVTSRLNPGCYYIHNDSGDTARVFLIDRAGKTRAEIRLKGADAVDYEDIALAPGEKPGTFDVCVADIGDNRAKRPNITIYRFPEVALPDRDGATIDVQPVAFRAHYADGPANAEAFFVHPRTGDGYILTKSFDGPSRVYKLAAPWDARQETELPRLLTLELPSALPPMRVVTGADISPDGHRVAVRCYGNGWEFRLLAGTADADFEQIFKTNPSELLLAAEKQGEAICYSPDGNALLTISEGESPTLWEVRANGSESAASAPASRKVGD